MKRGKMEQQLANEVRQATPNVLDAVLRACDEQKGRVIEMADNQKTGGKKRKFLAWAAAAAVFVLLIGSGAVGYTYVNQVDSVIAIDVNPSVEIQVNKREKIASVQAHNEDASKILDGMELKGVDLDVALNALVGSMVKQGYISDIKNSILISVDHQDAQKGEALQKRLMEEINRLLSQSSIDGALLAQNLSGDAQVKQLAEQYQISTGKAALIQEICKQDTTASFDKLAAMSIHELNLLAESKGVRPEGLAVTGTASTGAYIGSDKAKAAAFARAGVKEADAKRVRVELDQDNGRMVYEVSFVSGTTEYECEIDASSGDVLSFEREAAPGQDTGSSGSGGSSGQGGGSTGSATYIGEAKAREIACAHAGVSVSGVTFTKTKLDIDDGTVVYEIEFYTEKMKYSYDIHAVSGALESWEHEQRRQASSGSGISTGTAGGASAAYIGEEKAKQIALSHAGVSVGAAGGLTVKLEMEHGVAVYDIEFTSGRMEYDYEIDALAGTVRDWDAEFAD